MEDGTQRTWGCPASFPRPARAIHRRHEHGQRKVDHVSVPGILSALGMALTQMSAPRIPPMRGMIEESGTRWRPVMMYSKRHAGLYRSLQGATWCPHTLCRRREKHKQTDSVRFFFLSFWEWGDGAVGGARQLEVAKNRHGVHLETAQRSHVPYRPENEVAEEVA
eukprot:719460-Rhodomonas_salina.4